MRAWPVDVETGTGEEAVVVMSDGTREPLSEWMRRKLDEVSRTSPVENVGARIR